MKKMIALTLSAVLLLSMVGCAAKEEATPVVEPSQPVEAANEQESESCVSIAEMALSGVSLADMEACASQLIKAAEARDESAWEEAYTQMETLYAQLDTDAHLVSMQDFLMLSDSVDGDSTEYSALCTSAAAVFLSALRDSNAVFPEVVEKTLPETWLAIVRSYAEYDMADLQALLDFSAELEAEYKNCMEKPNPVRDWLSYVFVDLVATRNELAQMQGFKSYTDYAYQVIFARSFSPEDSQTLWSVVKESYAPLYHMLSEESSACEKKLEQSSVLQINAEEVLQKFSGLLETSSPELHDVMTFMQENGLYDVTNTVARAGIGSTAYFSSYCLPYLLVAPTGSWFDWTSIPHEFGHFCGFYYGGDVSVLSVQNMDLAELQSQGLELLSIRMLHDVLPDDWKTFEKRELISTLEILVDSTMMDEFLQCVYAEPDLTQERITELFREVYQSYGFTEYPTGDDGWTVNAQTYLRSFYSISYAVSGLSALQLYLQSAGDFNRAMDSYLQIVTTDSMTNSLPDALQKAGLTNYLETPEAAKELAGQVEAILES